MLQKENQAAAAAAAALTKELKHHSAALGQKDDKAQALARLLGQPSLPVADRQHPQQNIVPATSRAASPTRQHPQRQPVQQSASPVKAQRAGHDKQQHVTGVVPPSTGKAGGQSASRPASPQKQQQKQGARPRSASAGLNSSQVLTSSRHVSSMHVGSMST